MFENFKINYDLLRGLPKSKEVWPIWLGDHYTKGNLDINRVVQILGEKLSEELHTKPEDIVAKYNEFKAVWDKFCAGAQFGDQMYFENTIFRAVPEVKEMVEKVRASATTPNL